MRSLSFVALAVAACGGPAAILDGGGGDARGDSPPSQCQPLPAMGQFIRRQGNPRMLAGSAFSDGKLDISISDPDVRWDDAAQRYELYYMAAHAMTFSDPTEQVIRHATSPDRMTWTVDDAPTFTASADPAAWDHTHSETPAGGPSNHALRGGPANATRNPASLRKKLVRMIGSPRVTFTPVSKASSFIGPWP